MLCDLGRDVWDIKHIRLSGVACNEKKDPGGPETIEMVSRLLAVAPLVFPWKPTLTTITYKWDKYSPRMLGDIMFPVTGDLLTDILLRNGYAVAWNGRGPQPKVPFPFRPPLLG
jgi:hypothetical protein